MENTLFKSARGTAKIVLSPWQIDSDPDNLCEEAKSLEKRS